MADAANKENNTSRSHSKKKTGPQFKMVWDLNQGEKAGKKSQSSSSSKTEVGQLKKAVLHLNAKVDRLDQKLDRILELLLKQPNASIVTTSMPTSSKKPVEQKNAPSTAKEENSPKLSDVVILESPKSNRKTLVDCPQLTSTPRHKIAFPATPIQHHLTPIERVGSKNVTNSMESPLNKNTPYKTAASTQTKRPELKSAKKEPVQTDEPVQIVRETPTEEKVIKEETPFKVPKNKKTPALEVQVEDNSREFDYNPPLIMINSRSRARKQKQSAALKRISPAQLATISQAEGMKQDMEEVLPVNVPTNEPCLMQVGSKPIDVTRKCEPKVVPPVGRHDYSITDSMSCEETAKFLDVVTSTKSNKIAPPIITLDKSKTPIEPVQINIQNEVNSVVSEQTEIPRNSLAAEEFAKSRISNQPSSIAKKLTSAKKPSLQSTNPANFSMESIKQEFSEQLQPSQFDSNRPKRRAAPMSLKEKPLNTKMRRNH